MLRDLPLIQEWLRESEESGFARGRLEAARMIILKIAELRLGAPPAHVAALISECMDLERLIQVACEIVKYESWDESIPEHRDLLSGCRPFPESG